MIIIGGRGIAQTHTQTDANITLMYVQVVCYRTDTYTDGRYGLWGHGVVLRLLQSFVGIPHASGHSAASALL